MSCKRLYRFEIRYFNHNDIIPFERGFFIYRLNDNRDYIVQMSQWIENDKINKEDPNQRYQEIDKYLPDKDSKVMLIQYFQLNEDMGQDADQVCQFVQMQLQKYLNNQIEKITSDNVKVIK